jgi:hypothetical protein
MDLPFRVVRNFVRAFSPTLILLIGCDIWRNSTQPVAARQLAITIDVLALGVVLAMRLSPPFAGAREQLKSLFRAPWVGWIIVATAVLVPVLEKPIHVSMHKLLLLCWSAFCGDLARACRFDYEIAERGVRLTVMTAPVIGAVYSAAASYWTQMREGTFPWKNAAYLAVFVLIMAAIAALRWWAEGGTEPFPLIQELGLNRQQSISKSSS